MAQWQHGGGFPVDGSVRLAAADRAWRERLLRHCARPPFALDRRRERDREHLVYDPPKAGPGGSGARRPWRPRLPGSAATSVRSSPLPSQIGA